MFLLTINETKPIIYVYLYRMGVTLLDKIDEQKYKFELDRRIQKGEKFIDIYGLSADRIIQGIIIEAMTSAGYRRGRIAHVLCEAADAIEELPAKDFDEILVDFICKRYKKSKRD